MCCLNPSVEFDPPIVNLESAAFSAEPEAEIPMFRVASGVIANFAMVPKFERSARKSPRGR